jgi:phosphatidylinositol glycan class W
MDFGTGTMLFTDGYISSKGRNSKAKKSLKGCLLQVAVIALIGVLRFYINKLAGKISEPEEYGADWNFFYTLAFMRIVDYCVPEFICNYGMYICAAIMMGYDQVLKYGLSSYILNAERVDFISRNREGIVQLIGYSACTICGISSARGIANHPDIIRSQELANFGKGKYSIMRLIYSSM